MSISKQLAYPAVTPGARCVTKEMVLQPSTGAGTYSPGGVVRMAIPMSLLQYLLFNEGSLRFRVNNGGAAAFTVDHSAYSFISRVVVTLPNGTVLEDISEFGRLMAMLLDAQLDQSVRSSAYGAMLLMAEPATNDFTNVFNRVGVTIANAATATCNVPIPMGLALCSDKAFPASALAGGLLRLDLYLADVVTPVMGATNTDTLVWTLDNFELHIPYVELSPEADAMVKAASGGKIDYPIFTWATAINTITAGATNQLPIGIRQSSVISMIAGIFGNVKANSATTTNRIVGNRCNGGASSQFYLRIAGEIVPQNTIQFTANSAVGCSAVLAELEKIYRNMSTVYHGSCLKATSVSVTDAAIGTGAFMLGVDLRTQPESVSFGETFVGRNLLTSDLSLVFTAGAGAIGTQINSYWFHNRLLTIDLASGQSNLLQ